MKHQVLLFRKAVHTINQRVLEAGNEYETGGVLIGYQFGWLYLVVAATVSSIWSSRSRVSFILDGAEHTKKTEDIISSFRHSPYVLGIWHSHICDGHNFSRQDKASNAALAKTLGGALSMLVTQSAGECVLSVSHISAEGAEGSCVIRHMAMRAEK